MQLRVVLRTPNGETVTRDVRNGSWADPDAAMTDQVLGADLWALPGLVDAHAHLARESMDFGPGDLAGASRRATMALEAGVGLLLDKGWSDLTVIDLIDKVSTQHRPDIEAAGAIYAVEGGYSPGFTRNVAPGGVAAAVREASIEGRGWVKLIGDWPRKGVGPMPNFSESELATAVEVASRLGSRVAVHTMARDVPSVAVRAGVHSIEHGLFLAADDLGALGARGGSWVPTVVQVEALVRQLGPESSGGRLMREGLANMVSQFAIAVEAGVHVLAGTDLAVGSRQVALEGIRLWEMGMEPHAAVDAVSTSGFRATGRPAAFEVGTPANAVLFPEDPVLDPRVLSHPKRVIRMGRIVK
jgi:imidazolonepropionase-like amidohydrolase